MTLIEVRDSSSNVLRRCNRKCYGAKGKRCRCICGGLNHGVGYCQQLIRQTEKVLLTKGRREATTFIRYPLLDMDQSFLF